MLSPFFMPFGHTPRKLETEQELYTSALSALTRRAYSIHEMRTYLARRTDDKELISQVIARLREQKYLDDDRYATDFARRHARVQRRGRFRIARDLRARGVPDRYIDAALEVVFAEMDEVTLVRARLRRRLSHMRGALDQRKIASLYRSLTAAGFSSNVIRTELRGIAVSQGDLPEMVDSNEDE
jgi:regulatory protein